MFQAVFEFVAAPADEAFRSVRMSSSSGLTGSLGLRATRPLTRNLAGENGALGFFAAGKEAALNEGLVKPQTWHGAALVLRSF